MDPPLGVEPSSWSSTTTRRVSILYDAVHRHDYDSFGGGGAGGEVDDEDPERSAATGDAAMTPSSLSFPTATGTSNDENHHVILDLNSASMRRASRDLLSATHMRSRQLFVDLQYRPQPSVFSLDDGDNDDDDDGYHTHHSIDHDGDDDHEYGREGDDSSVTFTDTDNEALHPVSTAATSYGGERLEAPSRPDCDAPMSETRPLLPSGHEPLPSTPAPALKPAPSATLAILSNMIQQASAIAVVGLLSIMISIPFGASYFPIGWAEGNAASDDNNDSHVTDGTAVDGDISGSFPIPGKQALGIRMFLFATMMGQLAFTFSSKFENPVGLQMVENVPFLHALCHIVIQQQGYGIEALSTVCFLFGLSSVLVGTTFYLLGKWKLGRVVYFFPNHVLVGCIGGIGVFLIVTAMEVTSDTTFTFDMDGVKGLLSHWDLMSVVVGFETILRYLQHATKDKYGNAKFPMLSPIYYCMITPLFYGGLYIFGVSTQEASDRGFFFPAVQDDNAPLPTSVWHDPHLWDMFTFVDVTTLSWTAIFQSAGTMLALAAFSLIHVPINIPAFAISTDVGKWYGTCFVRTTFW
jgi:Sulfate permease family